MMPLCTGTPAMPLPSRLPNVLWLSLTLWVCLSGTGFRPAASAQETPHIDVPSVELGPDSHLRFQFHAQRGSGEDFEVEVKASLGTIEPWTKSTSAVIEAVAEGIFRVQDLTLQSRQFYRIKALTPQFPSVTLWINEVMTDNVSKLKDPDGNFYDWIEIYNPNDLAVDLAGYTLSDDPESLAKWRFPTTLLQPQGFVLVFASDLDRATNGFPLHANFKLRASGETVILSDPARQEVDRVTVPSLAPDQSLGRSPDGGSDFGVFAKAAASPGNTNPPITVAPAPAAPRFSPAGGVYPGSLQLTISAVETNQVIRYTTDGSPPTVQSPVLASPLMVSKTMVVRAIAVDPQGRKSESIAHTYLVGIAHQLPIVSLSTSPTNMEFRNGYLYGLGPAVINNQNQVLQNYPFSGSNAWKDREVEVGLEFFEPGAGAALRQRAGMKIYGGWGSRGYPQKSLALFARRSFGAGSFKHRIFPDQPVDEFESFVLRNSGNDNQSTHQTAPRPPITEFGPTASYGSYFVNGTFTLMRDAFLQHLLGDTTLDTQAYRPAVVYVNGDYWGIYNLREKVTEHQVLSHHDLPPGGIDLIEGYGTAQAGSSTVYSQLRQFLASKNLATGTNYAFVAEKYLDIDNFIDYHLAVIYFQNFDIGNIKCWRPRQSRGLFRWLVYDQDYGFGLWPASIYVPAMARDYADYDNMFKFYTAGTGTSDGWPNAGGRTLMLRSLLANPEFKERFIRRCADLLNSSFREDRVEQVRLELAQVIRPEIPAHLERWSWAELTRRGFGKPHQPEYRPFTAATWESNLLVLSEFGQSRPQKLRRDCQTHFRLEGGTGTLRVSVDPPNAAVLQVNSLRLETLPWSGVYFADFATTLQALPKPGFRFTGWTTPTSAPASSRIDYRVSPDVTNEVVAHFAPAAAPSAAPSELVITEIHYHPAPEAESGDWVELLNRGSNPLDLTGWIFRDEEDLHAFALPARVLAPGEFLVLVQDDFKFRLFHPASVPSVGNFRFGLGNEADTLRLYRPDGSVALSISYTDQSPWPATADGTGYTLQLTAPGVEAGLPANWTTSGQKGGTPGRF